MRWYPIEPRLEANKGKFSSFTLARDDEEVRVGPMPLAAGQEHFQQTEVMQDTYSLAVAGKLGLVGVGDINTSFGSLALVYEAMMYSEVISEQPIDGEVYGTRWGAGLRLAIKVYDIKADLKLDIGVVAAQAQLNSVKADYRLNILGISDPAILASVPRPGTFDFGSYSRILESTSKVLDYMAKQVNRNSIKPVPFSVFLRLVPMKDPFDSAQSVVFAMRQIANGKSMQEALRFNVDKGFSDSAIKATYKKYVVGAENASKPTREERLFAGTWLVAGQ